MVVMAEPLEDLISQSVLIRLDSPALTKALDKSSADENATVEISEAIRADTERLEELSGLYADGAITGPEWRIARDKIDTRLMGNRRTISNLRGNRELTSLVGQGSVLTQQWADLNLSRQVAIVKALVDHVRIDSAPKGRRPFDLNRVGISWRF